MFGKRGYGSADVHILCVDFEAFYGISMPYHPMMSVLKRATKRGYLERSHGRYSLRGVAAPQEISTIIAEQETQYQLVIREFLSFVRSNLILPTRILSSSSSLIPSPPSRCVASQTGYERPTGKRPTIVQLPS
jgi:hypothetical protein